MNLIHFKLVTEKEVKSIQQYNGLPYYLYYQIVNIYVYQFVNKLYNINPLEQYSTLNYRLWIELNIDGKKDKRKT